MMPIGVFFFVCSHAVRGIYSSVAVRSVGVDGEHANKWNDATCGAK